MNKYNSLNSLEKYFFEINSHYTTDQEIIAASWLEITSNYSDDRRYYHTLEHIEHLFIVLEPIKNNINCWEAVLFAICYHDIIYNPKSPDNEEKSALLATQSLNLLHVSPRIIALCTTHILASKSHTISTNYDTNYFMDADLCILGQSIDTYNKYYENIRKEYAHVSDKDFCIGRTKLLNYFLSKNRIYTTTYFYDRYESTARANLNRELIYLDQNRQ